MTNPAADIATERPDGLWVAALPKQRGNAVFFDGTSSRRHDVLLQFGEALEIIEDEAVIARWPYDQVRRVDGSPDKLRLSAETAPPLARLEIADEALKGHILSRCAKLSSGHHAPRQTGRIVMWSIAAVCSIVLMSLYGIPYVADRLAPLVPFSLEKRIGESVDNQVRKMFDGKACTNAEGLAAFEQLVEKLRLAGGIEHPLRAQVLSDKTPNAFALPGGKIYLLDGLLQRAQNPDEIAGVLAHELGHVQHRDTLRRVMQTGGTSFLLGLLFGDITGSSAVIFMGRSMLDASYSRETEGDADAFANEVMGKLGRSAQPMGQLLLRVTGPKSKTSLTILSSHPLSEDRLEAMKKQDRPISGPELLTAQEWQALKDVCKSTEARSGRTALR